MPRQMPDHSMLIWSAMFRNQDAAKPALLAGIKTQA
jgi:hypothetical protein